MKDRNVAEPQMGSQTIKMRYRQLKDKKYTFLILKMDSYLSNTIQLANQRKQIILEQLKKYSLHLAYILCTRASPICIIVQNFTKKADIQSMILGRGSVSITIELSADCIQSEEHSTCPTRLRLQKDFQKAENTYSQSQENSIKHSHISFRKSDIIFFIKRSNEEIVERIMHIILIHHERHEDFIYFRELSRQVKDISYRIASVLQAFKHYSFQRQLVEETNLETQAFFDMVKYYEDNEFRVLKYERADLIFKESFTAKIIEPYRQYFCNLHDSYDRLSIYEDQGEFHRGPVELRDPQNQQVQQGNWPSRPRNQPRYLSPEQYEAQAEDLNPQEDLQFSSASNQLQSISAEVEGLKDEQDDDKQSGLAIIQLKRWRKAKLEIFRVASSKEGEQLTRIQ